MIESSNFRQINEIEKEIILKSLSYISPHLSTAIKNLLMNFYISIREFNFENNFPKIYLISDNQLNTLGIISNNKNVYSAGLYFGFIKKGVFYLSLEGVEYLYNHKIFSDFQRLYVNENGEKSILYGNNILKNMIIKTPRILKENDFLLIFNRLDEIIGIAQSRVDNTNIDNFKLNDIIAINLNDKGIYLRKKQ